MLARAMTAASMIAGGGTSRFGTARRRLDPQIAIVAAMMRTSTL
jgi:hypothetical protein